MVFDNISPFCKYKNMFGMPNEGVHKYRIFGFAMVDIIMTILGALLISWIFNIRWWISMIGLFILGFILHIIFCVKTAFVKMIIA